MIIENATIIQNHEIASHIWELTFEAPLVSSFYKGAGQFILIQVGSGWEHPLRRPMSIASCNEKTMSIIYKIFGEGTSILSKKKVDDSINILGPLGNTFTVLDNSKNIFIGGGVGLAPIQNLWNRFHNDIENNYLIVGAKNRQEHIHSHNPSGHVYLTTDDGSSGIHGSVMNPLNSLCNQFRPSHIFACGPEPMLKAVQEFARIKNLSAQLSIESYMGCGVGICQGCVVSRFQNAHEKHSYHKQYSLVCTEGPVYNSKDITFD